MNLLGIGTALGCSVTACYLFVPDKQLRTAIKTNFSRSLTVGRVAHATYIVNLESISTADTPKFSINTQKRVYTIISKFKAVGTRWSSIAASPRANHKPAREWHWNEKSSNCLCNGPDN